MALPAAALHLAGFLMAHALWSVSDLPAGQDYTPQAICETSDGDRQLTTFDGANAEESYAKLRDFASSETGRYAECALARTTVVASGEVKAPALVIDLFAGPEPLLTIVQPFRPTASGGFRLLGPELMLAGHEQLPPRISDDASIALRDGAGDHPGMQDKWAEWNASRDPHSPLTVERR